MLKPLRISIILFCSAMLQLVLLPNAVLAQGCQGADGSGSYTGGIINRDNGTVCANNPLLPAVLEIDISNIDTSRPVAFQIDWDDNSVPEVVPATFMGGTRFFATRSHLFPPNGPDVQCVYTPTVRLMWNGALCPSAYLGTPPIFRRWNTDDENSGELEFEETITGNNIYEVCAGVETNVTFTDRSTLNCVPPDLTLGPNDKMRWRRFTYGIANTITGAVEIAGTPRTFPYNGVVDNSTEPTLNSGFPTATTQVITVPASAQVGQYFDLQMDYWNTCNPYPGRAPVSRTARILIVAQPPAPTGGDETVCNGNTPSVFSITGVPAGNFVNWYRNVPGSPDVSGTLISSGASTTLPVSAVPGYAGNATAAIYKVWASYTPNIANALNCESPRIPLTRTIREALTVPNPTTAPPAQICNGLSFAVGLTGPATETIGGATLYSFTGSGGVTVASSTANSATFDVNETFAPGELYVDRVVTIRRRYAVSPTCSGYRYYTVRVFNQPVGGTPSPFPDVCEGTSVGPITLTGQIGTIIRWEVEKDGGGFATYTGPASGSSITPGVLTEGLYRFRAIVSNGNCTPTATSSIETVNVTDNPTPPTAGIDQAFCGSLVSAAQGATLAGGTGTWTYESSVPAGRPPLTFTANDPNTTFSIANSTLAGAYTMKWSVVVGSCTFEDFVVIDFGANPAAVPVRNDNTCGESWTLTMPTPVIGSGIWTVDSAPGPILIDDPSSSTSTVSLVGPTFTYGAYVLRWTVTSGICPSETNTATITFHEPSTASSSDITGICLATGGSTIALTGTIGGGADTGTWTVAPGGGDGTITGVNVAGNVVTATYNSTALDYSNGTALTMRLTAQDTDAASPCADVNQDITITIDRIPVPVATTPIATCSNFAQLDAESPIPYGATGLWTGTGVTFDDPTDPQTIVRNLPAPGTPVTVRWTLTSAGANACTDFVNVTVNRTAVPSAADIDLLVCEESPAGGALTASFRPADYEATVTSIPVAQRTITWYQNAPPPAGIPVVDPTLTINGVTDGKVYVARIQETATGCTSDAFVTVNIRALPTATNATVALCEDVAGSNSTSNVDLVNDVAFRDAVTNGSNNITWFNTLAGASANNPLDQITSPFTVNGSLQVFARVTYSTAPTCVNIATLDLAVKPLPTNASILGRPQVCLGDPSTPPNELPVETYQVTSLTGAKYFWTIPTGAGKFKLFGGGGQNDFFALLQFPNIPTPNPESISVRIELNGCSSPVITLPITVSPQPVDPVVLGDQIVCENDDGLAYNVSPTNFPVSNYSWEVRKQSDDTEGGAFISVGQGTDQISLKFTDEPVYIVVREVSASACVSDTTQYWVNVNRRPIMFDSDATVCSDSPTGIVFTADGSSPVGIDKYDINTVITQSGINYVTPPSGPAYPVSDVADDAISTHIFENLTATPLSVSYTVTPISIGAGLHECSGPPQVVTVTVQPEPQLSPGLDRSICSGEESGITLISAANTFPADRFIIKSITLSHPTLVELVPGTAPVPSPITLHNSDVLFDNAWVNTTGVNQVVQYEVIPYSTLLGCAGDPSTTINVTIFPRTDVNAVSVAPICNGDALNVSFSSPNNSDANFGWIVKSYDPWVTVTGAGAGIGDISGMMITNSSTTVDGTVTFEVKGLNPPGEEGPGGCENPPITFVVTVRSSPVAVAQSLSACSDAPGGNTYTADLTLVEPNVNPTLGNTVIWYRTDPRLGPATVIPPAALSAFVMGNGIPVFVEVTNGFSCAKVVSVEYTVNPAPAMANVLSDYNGFNLNCNADNSGQIQSTITFGTPAFSYRIDGGPFINAGTPVYTFNSLAGGSHLVEVQDLRGCVAQETVVLVEPPALSAVLSEVQPITCFLGQDGIIGTVASGGTGTYSSYLLLQTNTTDPNNDGIFPNLGGGSYNVRVTDSNNCRTESNTVTLVPPPQVEINSLNVETDVNGFNLSCRDATDGEIEVTFSGGNTPPNYTITLTKSSDPLNPLTINTTGSIANFTNLGFGNYTAVARDAKGCPSLPASGIIVNPPPFSPGFVGINQSICIGDDPTEIQQLVPAFGGVGNYVYQWEFSVTGSNNDADWNAAPGASTGTTYDPPVPPQTIYYRRTVRSVSPRTGDDCGIVLGKDNIVKITVNPLPVVSFNAPSEVCQGDSFSLQLGMSGGTAPIEFDYSAGATTFLNLIGTENTAIPVSNFQQPETYTLLRVKDLNGCLAANVPQVLDVDIIKLNPDFQVLAPAEQCSGGTFTFQWVAEEDVKYTWIWTDGQQTIVNPGEVPLGVNTITHVFTAGSTESSTIYPVRLQAENALCAPKFATKPITVFPNVVLNILPGDPILCSGESIRFVDQSTGVDNGKWYYHLVGSTDQMEVRSGPVPNVTYVMTNNTTTNPIFYEVVYEASNNEGCSAEFRQEVKVYRNITAVIANTPDPPAPFTGGISTIVFNNNSTPLDENDFEYTWDFGDARATPSTGSGIAPISVDYYSAGIKDIKLTAVNIKARDDDNKTCQSAVIKKINIELPVLGAVFRATPLASCFPVNITVENLSPGADTFLWELYDESGLVTTSTLRNPVFRILKPGVYDIYLTASFYATGQTAMSNQKGIEVFDVPTALFEMRPNPLYVPDTELQTFNQSSRASQYHWDFDDGYTSEEFQPRHLYQLEGKYMITLIAGYDNGNKDVDGDGILDGNVICYDTVRNELEARDGGFIKLPNAFTPSINGSTGGVSGSGTFNDVFLPIARGVEEFSMQIFDRWGNLIFETQDRNVGWDGYDRNKRLMPAGVYVYKLILRLSNGQRTTKVGDVTLIR